MVEKIPASGADERFFGESVSGKIAGFAEVPLPPPLNAATGAGVCKNALQNLERQGFKGENLEYKRVRSPLPISVCTASALTTICGLNSWIKVRGHTGLWKTEGESRANPTLSQKERKDGAPAMISSAQIIENPRS
jgi:hypothetical protein